MKTENIYTQSKNSLSASFPSDTEFSAKVKSIKNLVIKREKKEDAIRNSKLSKLIHEKSTFNYTKVKLINLTDIFIPLELQELLELGPTNSKGGYVQHEGSDIFFALNALHTKIKKDAREQNNDEFSIEDLRCSIMRTGRKLSFCNTQDTRVKKFLSFKREHPDILFMQCDKSKNVCVILKKDYIKKLNNLFKNSDDFFKIEILI